MDSFERILKLCQEDSEYFYRPTIGHVNRADVIPDFTISQIKMLIKKIIWTGHLIRFMNG